MEKMISDPNLQKEINKANVNMPKNNTNDIKDSNPFAEAFKDMSNSFNMPNTDPFQNMFKNGNFSDDMNNMDKDGFLKNLYGVLGKLSDSSEKDSSKMSQEELYPLFESLFDILLKEDMTTPLNQIKNSVNTYLVNNASKINEEEKEKYKCVNKYIDTILIELKRAEPDKKLIIETFQKLHELSDFGSDIFGEGGDLISGLGAGLGKSNVGGGSSSGGSDLKDIADKFFKK